MLKDNWLAYLIMGVVLLHLVVGFVWLMIKLNKKTNKDNKTPVDQAED